jgi:hypothetical protein
MARRSKDGLLSAGSLDNKKCHSKKLCVMRSVPRTTPKTKMERLTTNVVYV